MLQLDGSLPINFEPKAGVIPGTLNIYNVHFKKQSHNTGNTSLPFIFVIYMTII